VNIKNRKTQEGFGVNARAGVSGVKKLENSGGVREAPPVPAPPQAPGGWRPPGRRAKSRSLDHCPGVISDPGQGSRRAPEPKKNFWLQIPPIHCS